MMTRDSMKRTLMATANLLVPTLVAGINNLRYALVFLVIAVMFIVNAVIPGLMKKQIVDSLKATMKHFDDPD